MNVREYQIELKHWITRKTIVLTLGETIGEAKEKLKQVRRKYNRFWWKKTSPIFC